MGKITGFMEFDRQDRHYRPVEERVKHWQRVRGAAAARTR